MQDISLPEVKSHGLAARFYRFNNRDMVEISFIGSKDSISQRVTPQHMAEYRDAWNAYCDGREPSQRAGTPLTELKAISEPRAKEYIHRNVHNLEELAALNDGQCQMLGHGTLTDRKGARELVARLQFEKKNALEKRVHEASASIGAVPDKTNEVEALKADVAELKQGIAGIMELLQARKGGRPKKAKATE
jgi:hypothetical protein